MAVNVTDIKAREATAPPIPEEKETPLPGYTCELTRPIEAHGNTLTVLTFREPTARDLLSIGNPVIFDPISDPPKIMHDEKRMNQCYRRSPACRRPRSPRSRRAISSHVPGA